jgi:hypothetical protein
MEFNNQYLTYEEYQELGGTLDETPFNILEIEAQLNVDNYTHGRLKRLNKQVNEVKLCINSLIATLKNYADSNSRDRSITSENTDGYSVSYAGISVELTKTQKTEVRNIIDIYLSECKLEDGTPYLYMGR